MKDDVPRAGMKGVDFRVTSVIVSDAVAELKNINVTDSFVMPDPGPEKRVTLRQSNVATEHPPFIDDFH